MIQAIIFDCFGVLITDALKAIRDELYRRDPEGAREVDQLIRAANLGIIDSREANESVAALFGLTIEEYRARINSGEVRNTPLFDYIAELKKTYKTAMLSNISVSGLNKRFSAEELRTYFDTVVTSGESGFAKPSPEIYEITADRLGVRCDESVFIDDREVFVEAARAVGMQGIVFTGLEQLQKKLSTLIG